MTTRSYAYSQTIGVLWSANDTVEKNERTVGRCDAARLGRMLQPGRHRDRQDTPHLLPGMLGGSRPHAGAGAAKELHRRPEVVTKRPFEEGWAKW